MLKQEKKYTGYDAMRAVLGDDFYGPLQVGYVDGYFISDVIRYNSAHFDESLLRDMFLTKTAELPEPIFFTQGEYVNLLKELMYIRAVCAVGEQIVALAIMTSKTSAPMDVVCRRLIDRQIEVPVTDLTAEDIAALTIVTTEKFDLHFWDHVASECDDASLLLNAAEGAICIRMSPHTPKFVVLPTAIKN